MYDLMMCLSRSWDKTAVVEIGLYSLGCIGLVTFGTGVILAAFHCCGTTAATTDRLNSSEIDAAKTGAQRRRNKAGMRRRPVAMGRRRSSK